MIKGRQKKIEIGTDIKQDFLERLVNLYDYFRTWIKLIF